jgi:methionine-R-sulfoxide reductase
MNWNDVLNFSKNNPAPDRQVKKSDAEWQQQLTPEQYRVTRQHGTEVPFSGEYCEAHSPGVYACVCCETELFDSTLKFDSGTGWPSFTEPVKDNVIRYIKDTSYGMVRIEVLWKCYAMYVTPTLDTCFPMALHLADCAFA